MSSPTPPPESPWARPDGQASAGAVRRPGSDTASPSGGAEPIRPRDAAANGSNGVGLIAGPIRVFGAGPVTGVADARLQDDPRETWPDQRAASSPDRRRRSPDRRSSLDLRTGTSLDWPDLSDWPAETDPAPPMDAAKARRRAMRWFGGTAGAIVAAGMVVLLSMVLTGHSPFPPRVASSPDTRPALAKLCPPPSAAPVPPGAAPATPAGPRTVDRDSGLSYRAYGTPWRTWDLDWETGGQLGVTFRSGEFFVTELYRGGDYMATILSGSVPATTNDALTLDLECAGHQVAADVRAAYYPQPNTMNSIVDKATVLGGRPAWLSEFELHFHADGLAATNEMVAVALLDVGKPNASILYISIPGTHKQYDYVINQLLASVRPT